MIQLPRTAAPATALAGLLLVACYVALPATALDPAALLDRPGEHAPALVLSALAHAGLAHLGGNLLLLAGAGSEVERRLGGVRLWAVLLLGAVAGGLAHVAAGQTALVVGASGAIAAVVGAQLAACPRAEVPVLHLLLLPRPVLRVPAALPSLVWLAVQGLMLAAGETEVAVWAHLGGFAAGLVLGGLAVATEEA